MSTKLELWLRLLFEIRAGNQIIVVRDLKEHPDVRSARLHLKNFEIWHLSKSLVLYPDGYRKMPAEEFEGLDGTMPDVKEEQTQIELAGVLREWLKFHRDAKIFFLHCGDPFWKLTCQMADANSTDTLTVAQLGVLFNLKTGEKEDQKEEYPRRLKDFLDNLSPEQERKLLDFVADGGLD